MSGSRVSKVLRDLAAALDEAAHEEEGWKKVSSSSEGVSQRGASATSLVLVDAQLGLAAGTAA